MQAITHLIAGVPVSDLDAGIDWYTRFFGRPPDLRVGEEILWDVDEHATLFIEPDAARAGAGRITFAGVALDSLLEHLAAQGIEHELMDDSDGARYVKIPDPDGNAIAFAGTPTPRAPHLDRRGPGRRDRGLLGAQGGRPLVTSSGSAARSRTIRSRAIASRHEH